MNDFEKSGEFMLAKNEEGKAVVLRATDEGSLLASSSTLEVNGEDSSVDVAGSYLLAKNPDGETVIIRATNEGKLLIEGGGGGGMPAAHAETHLPETGSDPLPTANASRWGLTKVSNALTSTNTEVAASADALRRVNESVSNKLNISGGDMTGAIGRKYAATLKTYKNVAGGMLGNVGGGLPGAAKITLPKTFSGTITALKIEGYEHSAGYGSWTLDLTGFANTSSGGTWASINSAFLKGNAPFSSVTLGFDGTNLCILLGGVETRWNYAYVVVSEFIASQSNVDGWESGWNISLITDISGITKVVQPTLQKLATQTYLDSFVMRGAGSPEGVITASPGRLYENTNGGANTTLYVKESGTGNTGWVAK